MADPVLPGRSAPVVAYVALGSNLGDRAATLDRAVVRLGDMEHSRVLACSRWLATSPVGPVDQPDFLNGACALVTALDPAALLLDLLRIESEFGRDRSRETKWGPRTLDLDLLLHGTLVVRTDGLEIPHPRMHERRFVLEPLAQIGPHAIIPTLGVTVQAALRALE